jgi:carboxyl-terminal processing protease
MRGKVGSQIKITVLREGAEKPLDFELVRAVIKIESVRSRVEGDVGYIRVTSFSEQTANGVEKALVSVKQTIGESKIKGVVLDLRNNPGGLLDQAIELSDMFLEEGEIVSTRGRTESSSKRFHARPGDISNGLPVVVLVNGGSASASEIVAGALQDHKRAVVMGTKSFGKGSVQTVIPIPGHGAMRLTTSRYYTPSGRSIQAEGIAPDILVEPSRVVPIDVSGARSEADLPGHLSQAGGVKNEKDKAAKAVARPKDGAPEEEDYQLQRALDFLAGVAFYRDFNGTQPAEKLAEAAESPANGD